MIMLVGGMLLPATAWGAEDEKEAVDLTEEAPEPAPPPPPVQEPDPTG